MKIRLVLLSLFTLRSSHW